MSDAPPALQRASRTPTPVHTPRTPKVPRGRVRALECRIDGGAVAIPVDAVGQIVEYDVAPLPLARGAVRGLGIVDGKLVVSLGIGRRADARRHTKGVLLRTEDPAGHWALEVVEVLSFIEASPDDAADRVWIDAERLVADADLPFASRATK